MDKHTRAVVDGAASRQTGPLSPSTFAYETRGGTYVIASKGLWNDDGRPHDLVIILPSYVEIGGGATRVVPARLTVNPDLVDALREALDGKDV